MTIDDKLPSVKEFFERAREAAEKAHADLRDERECIEPFVDDCDEGIFYEDQWVRIAVVERMTGYQLEWTNYRKSGDKTEIRSLSGVESRLDACHALRGEVYDYWTAGTLHPLMVGMEAVSKMDDLFGPFEQKYLQG